MEQRELSRLIGEFRQRSLTETESKRGAFCVLACNRGWSTARTARYLGISRARVGQRVERLRGRADSGDMPLTARLLACQDHSARLPELPVSFPASNWDDPTFADGILKLVA